MPLQKLPIGNDGDTDFHPFWISETGGGWWVKIGAASPVRLIEPAQVILTRSTARIEDSSERR
jgi:hypothetical protein